MMATIPVNQGAFCGAAASSTTGAGSQARVSAVNSIFFFFLLK